MPELAALHFVGVAIALLLSGIFHALSARNKRSPKMQRLQSNLGLIKLRWSDQQSRILPLDDHAIATELASERRSALVLTALTAMASWLGVLILLILTVSALLIARPRLETKLLVSRLAEPEPLSEAEIRALVRELDPNASAS